MRVSSSTKGRETAATVTVGSKVTVCFPSGDIRSFVLTVQSDTVAPGSGIISVQSPLGAALLGKTVGELATYAVCGQKFSTEIIEIKSDGYAGG